MPSFRHGTHLGELRSATTSRVVYERTCMVSARRDGAAAYILNLALEINGVRWSSNYPPQITKVLMMFTVGHGRGYAVAVASNPRPQ